MSSVLFESTSCVAGSSTGFEETSCDDLTNFGLDLSRCNRNQKPDAVKAIHRR